MFIKGLVNTLTRAGKKERSFRQVYDILQKIKFELNQNPLALCALSLKACETRLELKLSNLMRFQKKKQGEVKIRGRLVYVGELRAQRRAIKELSKSIFSRSEQKLKDKIYGELIDLCVNKGLTVKKKRDFYALIQKIRPSVEVVKRRKRRKKVNKL
jgi:ribosomal protein S7